jgi:hypothetical protein
LTLSATGHSETEAFDAYSGAIQRAVACFVDRIVFRRALQVDPEFGGRGLTHGGAPFRLHDRHGTAVVAAAIRLHYRSLRISTTPQKWSIETVRYVYEVHSVTRPPREIAGYHWHPTVQGMTYAHCHAYDAPPHTRRLHLPTQFITIREFFSWLMRDFDVAPLATDWQQALEDANAILQHSLRWTTAHP